MANSLSVSDLFRAWLIRQLGLSSPSLSLTDMQTLLYAKSAGLAGNRQFKSTLWYPSEGNGATTTVTPALNTFVAVPFEVGQSGRFTDIGFNVTTAGVATTANVGIYTSTNGLPDQLVAGSSVTGLSTTAIALVSSTYGTAILLDPGLYWLAFKQQGTTAAIVTGYAAHCNRFVGSVANPGGNNYSCLSVVTDANALPQTAPAVINGTTNIKLHLKAA